MVRPRHGVCGKSPHQPTQFANCAQLGCLPKGDNVGYSAIAGGARSVRCAEVGDIIYLKGHLWRGNHGKGTVHRSPGGVDA
jgi:hypothetical protein